ncbi:MAG TPA: DUF4157 domain-containing protein [Longimicrobium sp.]|nr:DUF4157 domain-containing protein [Longimicrobium sp.]
MGAAVAEPQKKRKAPEPAPEPQAPETDAALERGMGAGVPLFLRRSARAAAAPPSPDGGGAPVRVQRKCAACAAGLPCTGGGCDHEDEEKPIVQPKLAVGPVDDPLEREADQVAAAVASAAGPRNAPPPATAAVPTSAPDALPRRDEGSPLPRFVRARIEPVLGMDLGAVRVHDDDAARGAAGRLGARAFTHGSRIWLGAGESAGDVGLMAHEAAHVAQQAGGRGAGTLQRSLLGFGADPDPVPASNPAVCTPAAVSAARDEVVELKGTGTFNPSADLADMIECAEPAALGVKVRFGTLASGILYVRRVGGLRPVAPVCTGCHGSTSPRWRGAGASGYGGGGGEFGGGGASGSWDEGGGGARGSSGAGGSGGSGYSGGGGRSGGGGASSSWDPFPGTPRARRAALYETVDDDPWITLTHPAFPGGGLAPHMHLTIRDSVVTGRIDFGVDLSDPAQAAVTLAQMLGWRGLSRLQTATVVNQVSEGVLRYSLPDFLFRLENRAIVGGSGIASDDGPEGTGAFSVVDEAQSFSAEAVVRGDGIDEARMPLRRVAGRIFGSQSFSLALAPTDAFGGAFSGSLQGTFADGVLVVQGTARYRSRKANGSLTVMLAPRGTAWMHVMTRLPGSRNTPGVTVGAATAPGMALVGWGTLDFAVNEWLTGSVSVVMDPDGFITSHGILRPTRQFQFLDDPERYSTRRRLVDPIADTFVIAPIWGPVSISADVAFELWGGARVGPGRVYGLEVEGTFSTRPGSVFEARATGRVSLLAGAALQARISGGLHLSLLRGHGRVVEVRLNATGTATVRAAVEIQPTFERLASSAADGADYRITGRLEAVGAVDLGLAGSVNLRVFGFGPRINLGRYQIPLGGVAMTAQVSHVLGSGDPIVPEFELADFDGAAFGDYLEDLFNEEAEANTGEHDEELSQDPATRPPDDPATPTTVRVSFSMHGADHTLWLEHRPGPVLMMASGEGPLVEKLRAEVAADERAAEAAEGDEAELARQQAGAARGLLGQAQAVERSLLRLESEREENPDAAGVDEVAAGLSNFGAQYDKTDLAEPAPAALPPAPDPAVAAARVDDRGRYIITNRAELEAVRAAKEPRPADLPDALATKWTEYSNYFDNRIRLIDRDLTPPRRTVRHTPPSTWAAYAEARDFYALLSARKEFQTELRETMMRESGDPAAMEAEIDVGLQKGRRRVRYADLVVTRGDNLEVYSLKVRNVAAQAQRMAADDVRVWIRQRLREDVREAIDFYGGRVEFRRPYRSTSEGRGGSRSDGPHPRFGTTVFVNRVILVWRGAPDVVPEEFRDYIITQGNMLGAEYRSTISCEVRLNP